MDKFTYQAEKTLARMKEVFQKEDYSGALDLAEEAHQFIDDAYENDEHENPYILRRLHSIEEELSHYIWIERRK